MTRILKWLSYKNLTVDEFGQSNIPDDNLFSAYIGGSLRKIDYDLVFYPPRGKEYACIEVDGKRSPMPKKPEHYYIHYKVGSSNIHEVLVKLQKIVKGNIELFEPHPDLDDTLSDTDMAYINNPKIKMSQKGIAEVVRRIENELKFGDVIVEYVYYRNVVPLDLSLDSLGFNLPSQKITAKEWGTKNKK